MTLLLQTYLAERHRLCSTGVATGALVTAFMFATLDLSIVHINIEPPEAISQMLISVATFFVFSIIYCSVVALVLGLPLIALTRSRMQIGLSVATAQGAILGLVSAGVGMVLFFFNGPVSSILIIYYCSAHHAALAPASSADA